MKPSAYIKIGANPDGSLLIVRTNSSGAVAVQYKGYSRPEKYGFVLYPAQVNHGLLEPGIITNAHYIHERMLEFKKD